MSAAPGALERVNILLVDDRQGNLLSLEAMLRRDDYRLLTASSGEEALSHLLREEVALILMDVAMPIMDGFQTANLIRGREQSRNIPIVFVTASVYDLEHIFRDHAPGRADYLRKPLDVHEVRSKVALFIELYRQRKQIERQAAQLREAALREPLLARAQAEGALREDRIRELTQAVRARDHFLSCAARELKSRISPPESQDPLAEGPPRPGEPPLDIEFSSERLEHLVDRLLEVVRRIVEAHGGQMAISTQPGEGFVWTLELPLAASTARGSTPGLREAVDRVH